MGRFKKYNGCNQICEECCYADCFIPSGKIQVDKELMRWLFKELEEEKRQKRKQRKFDAGTQNYDCV